MTVHNDSHATLERGFLASSRPHVLMITNHGIHEWQLTAGLPDTGGQNVYVNMFSDALVEAGYKVTIVNRGGFEHPITGEWHGGRRYKGESQRIVYIEDDFQGFVRKEDMAERIPSLVDSLAECLRGDGLRVDLILSHYWDAGKIGLLLNRRLPSSAPHIWVPHSLGALKKRNSPRHQWKDLRVEERILEERDLLKHVDGVATTSKTIADALHQDYGYSGPTYFLPPGIQPDRFKPREVPDGDPLWDFLAEHSGKDRDFIRGARLITEVSRTDATKRKDVAVDAFNAVARRFEDAFLVLTLDETRSEIGRSVHRRVEAGGMGDRIATVGSIWEWLPRLYAASYVYLTPSVMEGFGMSIQEAAACRTPAVASHLVPFATEYLLGTRVAERTVGAGERPIRVGEGAVVVEADDVDGFGGALDLLFADSKLRETMAENAYRITVPAFTWSSLVAGFLAELGLHPGKD